MTLLTFFSSSFRIGVKTGACGMVGSRDLRLGGIGFNWNPATSWLNAIALVSLSTLSTMK